MQNMAYYVMGQGDGRAPDLFQADKAASSIKEKGLQEPLW